MTGRSKDILIVVAFLSLPILVFYSNGKSSRDHNMLDRALLCAIMPAQLALDWAFAGLSTTWHSYAKLLSVQSENERLRSKLAELRLAKQELAELRLEAERLRLLLHIPPPDDYELLGARVIARSPSPAFHSVRLNRGSKDGISLGAGVVSPAGVIGRVAAISSSSADVMLLTDANATIDVLVQRTRSQGRTRGLGRANDFAASLEYLLRVDEVSLGDTIITSGLDGVFPKGFLVGSVARIRRRRFGLYQEVDLSAAADFSKLEELLILLPLEKETAALKQTDSNAKGSVENEYSSGDSDPVP